MQFTFFISSSLLPLNSVGAGLGPTSHLTLLLSKLNIPSLFKLSRASLSSSMPLVIFVSLLRIFYYGLFEMGWERRLHSGAHVVMLDT